ncbi:hypothetical protein AGMMS49574_06230 [Bacteroidia bacterium]|nr:hypothetical protein AGMMS49574_06230 [Bacteroidia bacterium]
MSIVGAYSQSKTYFVSPNGNDNANGLSIKNAWKSLDKVNQVTFLPGDNLLFETGGVWKGQLKPQGSGEEGKPITLSSYGVAAKPVINIGRAEGAGIRLTNQSWWEISNMEITSGAAPELGIGRQGIVAIVNGENHNVKHIVVRDCYIHDIWGQLGGNTEYTGYNSCGILVKLDAPRNVIASSSLNDVLIENNRIERLDKCGIIVGGCTHNMLVRKNQMDNLGGDGIFCSGMDKGIIEYNVIRRSCMRSGYQDLPGGKDWWPHTAACWIARATESIMQFNEVYDTGREPGNGDGEAYDFDFDCVRCILQYNYSKNNAGFLLIMNRTLENIARYNISENDRTHLIQLQCNVEDRNVIYNNVFYVDYGTLDLDIFCGNDGKGDKSKLGSNFHNNIFYATGQGRFRTVYASGEVIGRTFDETTKLPDIPGSLFFHNCYFGPWKNGIPNDPEKIVADPLFVAPGTGGNGLCTLEGYRLQEGSPCINTGIFIPFNGIRDFFGNPVNDGSADLGAYEQIGSGVFADLAKEEKLNRDYSIQSRLAVAKFSFPRAIIIPENNGKITVTLNKALESSINGSLVLKVAKPETVLLNKPAQRNGFTFSAKTDPSALTGATVHVVLQDQEFKEEWDIPLTKAPVRR